MKKIAALVPFILLAAVSSAASAADLRIAVDGAGKEGVLHFALFDKEGFLRKPVAMARADKGAPLGEFRNLKPGSYALTVFQDLNGNGQLDRNLFGMPTEPFGFSNDAMGRMGPPDFDQAAIVVGAENRSVSVTLRH